MIQLRLILLGVTVVASIGYAVYKHYQSQSENRQQHSYGPQGGSRGGSDYDYPSPPSTISSNDSEKPRKRRKAESTQSECSICLRTVRTIGSKSRYLNCGHVFHEHCIQTWLNTQETCPNCRANVQA